MQCDGAITHGTLSPYAEFAQPFVALSRMVVSLAKLPRLYLFLVVLLPEDPSKVVGGGGPIESILMENGRHNQYRVPYRNTKSKGSKK